MGENIYNLKMGCRESKTARVEPEYTCTISPDDLGDSAKGIYLGKITNHYISLAENCIDGDKKNKQLQELQETKGKIIACGFLHDGSAVLADEVRKIILLVQKNKETCNFLLLKSDPIDIAVLGIDIFVTLSDKKVIHAAVVNDRILHQNTFKTSQSCLGIASFNGDIAVGFKNGEIHVLDRKFQKHADFFLPKFEDGRLMSPTSMTQFRQSLLVTDCFAHAVVRVTIKGEPLFVYAGMTSPRCTVVDNYGNIILAGYDDLTGEKIQHLSPRGEKIPSRMATADFVQFPYCAAFYRKYSKLLVAGESDRCETCTLQIVDDTSFRPEIDAELDNASDIVSAATTLTFIENTHSKTNGKLPVTNTVQLPNTVDEATSVMDLDNTPDADAAKIPVDGENIPSAKDEEALETSTKKTSDAIVEKSTKNDKTDNTSLENTETLTENTAVTVFDKTQKGVVKKVLITVREKPPAPAVVEEPITASVKPPKTVDEKMPFIVHETRSGSPTSTPNPSDLEKLPNAVDEKLPIIVNETQSVSPTLNPNPSGPISLTVLD